MKAPRRLIDWAPLAPGTTLGVGGPARFLARCSDLEELQEALAWGQHRGLEIALLGGGSNLLVSDAGFPGLVVQLTNRHLRMSPEDEAVRIQAGAGLPWDDLVATAVANGLAGIEALSGIPGLVGAAPIQNIGAYGQELSETLDSVEVVEIETGEASCISAKDCRLGYRFSRFKADWAGRFAVLSLTLSLPSGVPGTLRYRGLEERFDNPGQVTPADVRKAVLEIRRSKSMVLDPDDPNRRSAGSFFVNPVLETEEALCVKERVLLLRGRDAADSMPCFSTDGRRSKLSAAWLIEAAGFHKGYCLGPAGLSSRHVLALINRGGASAAHLLELAGRIRRRVREAFGVSLWPEPRFLGFEKTVDELLG